MEKSDKDKLYDLIDEVEIAMLTTVEGMPDGGKIQNMAGIPSAFTPDYAPEEMFEIASRLTKAANQGAGSL